MVACGKYHSLFLIGGWVFSVGAKEKGVLGRPPLSSQEDYVPMILTSLRNYRIEGVSWGAFHWLAWSSSGKLFSWGKISEGCLGYMIDDKSDIQVEPKMIDSLGEYDIWYSGCGLRRSMALTTWGKVFSWGKGDREMSSGLFDYFEPMNLFESKQFKGATDLSIVQISWGPTHWAALTSGGKLYMWGDLSLGCQGNIANESMNRKHSFLPQQVDHFSKNGYKVYKVACGNWFTAVWAIPTQYFGLATKYMKATNSDHISVSLKKKLSRRIEFSKYRKHFTNSKQKYTTSSTLRQNITHQFNNRNVMQSNSHKNINLEYMKAKQSGIFNQISLSPHSNSAAFDMEKYRELKNNPRHQDYFRKMMPSNYQSYVSTRSRKNSKQSSGKGRSKSQMQKNNAPYTKESNIYPKIGKNHHIESSESVGMNKNKWMEQNIPETKRARKKTTNSINSKLNAYPFRIHGEPL